MTTKKAEPNHVFDGSTQVTDWRYRLNDIIKELTELGRAVEERGQQEQEHGGRLRRKVKAQLERLTDEMLDDLAVYTITLRDQHQRAIEELRKGLSAKKFLCTDTDRYTYVYNKTQRALNILTKGSPEGDSEADE